MTVSSPTNRADYVGNGVATSFAYGFRIFAATDLTVTRATDTGLETTLSYPSDYTVSGIGNRSGGAVVLTTALPSNYALTIRRVLPLKQSTDFRGQGTFLPETHEDQFDRVVMMAQQLAEVNGRMMALPVSVDPGVVSPLLPPPVANRVLIWNPTATALITAILDTSAIGVPGEGRTVATATAFLANNAEYNVTDYGAVGNNSTICTTAFQNAANAAAAAGGGLVRVPKGTFKITGTITLASNVTLAGRGWQSAINAQCADMLFYANGQSNVTIRDLKVTGVTSACVRLVGGSGHLVQNCSLSGASIYGTLGGAAGVMLRDCSNTIVDSNTFTGNGDGLQETTSDIGIFGGYNNEQHGIQITNNKCLSTGVYINIHCFNIFKSFVTGNECTGAMVMVPVSGGGRGGYGIMLYNATTVPPYDVMYDNDVSGNLVHDVQGTGIYLQRARNTTCTHNIVRDTASVQTDGGLAVGGIVNDGGSGNVVANNSIYNSNRHGIVIVGGGGAQSINIRSVTSGNLIDNIINNSYFAVCVRGTPSDALIIGNTITRVTGSAIGEWSDGGSIRIRVLSNTIHDVVSAGVLARAASVDWTIAHNVCSLLTDPTQAVLNLGANNAVIGNAANGSKVFPVDTIQSRVALNGDASSATPQLQLGTSNGQGAVGARFSGGDAFIATNATHNVGADLWTQSSAGSASWLLILNRNGDIAMHTAIAGKAPGTMAVFWGTPVAAFRNDGVLKIANVAVLRSQLTGWTPQTAVASRADLGANPTNAAIASWAAAVQNDLTTQHKLLGP